MNNHELILELERRRADYQGKIIILDEAILALKKCFDEMPALALLPAAAAAAKAPGGAPGATGGSPVLPRPGQAGSTESRPASYSDAVLMVMKKEPGRIFTTSDLILECQTYFPDIKRAQIGGAVNSLRCRRLINTVKYGSFQLRIHGSTESRPTGSGQSATRMPTLASLVRNPRSPADASPRRPHQEKDRADELATATALERQKQQLGIPSGAAVPADPALLARKRQME